MRLSQAILCGLLALAFFSGIPGRSQTTVPLVMLADIHFDPFHNPSKLPQLRAEPIDRWPAILNTAPSAADDAALQALQTNCRSHALDTAWPLLTSALTAAHDAEPHPLFVTLSGDLLTHDFPCRFYRSAPGATPQDLAAFASKTISFVLAQLAHAFPHIPVYASLGNNDSGCNDYRETPNDLFLQQTAAALRAATLDPNLTVTPTGDYSLQLPPPMEHTRLLVLEDTFASRQFATCAGAPDHAAERAQLDWLRTQLADAQSRNQQVWFMSHIPPGIDVYTSFRRYILQPAQMCNATPRPFLADTTLSDALLDYAGTVTLALFGHTHMDEIRLLRRDSIPAATRTPSAKGLPLNLSSRPEAERSAAAAGRPAVTSASAEGSSPPSAPEATIPAKLVPSVTPFAGNHPAFLVASVDPRTAILKDWRTFVSPGPEGSTPPWTEAYRFTSAYHLPDFSAASALKLADSFIADKTGQAPESATFRQHVYPGDLGIYALGLAQIWPAYGCAVREDRPSAVQKCICATLPASAPHAAQP